MARIPGASRNQGGPIRRLFVGIVYALTRRRLRPSHHADPGDGASSQNLTGDTSRWSNRRPGASWSITS